MKSMLCGALLLGSQLWGLAAEAQEIRLVPGQPTDGAVVFDDHSELAHFVTYVLDIDDDVVALRIELKAAADLDLFADTVYINDYDDVLASSTTVTGSELLLLDFALDESLISNQYYIDVAWGRADLPVNARGQSIERVPFTLTATPYRQRIDGELTAGKPIADALDPINRGPYRNYVIDVPADATQLRVDLVSDATDLDLRVRRGKPMRTLFDADATAVSWAGSETIVVGDADDPIRAGRYYIDVFDQAWLDWPAEYRLIASLADAPPAGLIDLPVLSGGSDIEAAARATVEILHDEGGGTGAILTDTGYILTNYHVVEHAIEASPLDKVDLMIGLTVDPSEASKMRLLGRIVAFDSTLDLALLKADTDLYGQPIADSYRFPTLPLGQPRDSALGDALFVLGYPTAGSLGTRASITLTEGVLSGFERRGGTVLIKTDADIAAGNSGGPVLNERLELLGLATETISEEFGNSQIGYIFPLWLVPPEWWDLAGLDYTAPAR